MRETSKVVSIQAATQSTLLERSFRQIWREILGVIEDVPAQHFFEVGGTSLDAIRLQSRVRAILGVELPMDQVFRTPHFQDLLEFIRSAEVSRGPERTPGRLQEKISKADEPTVDSWSQGESFQPSVSQGAKRDLTGNETEVDSAGDGQRSLYTVHSLDEGSSAAYGELFAYELIGPVDCRRLQQCFEVLVRRHEVLRTTFEYDQSGELLQKIHADLPPDWLEFDLRHVPFQDRLDRVEETVRPYLARTFDLQRGPMMRVIIVRVEEQTWHLYLQIHHIAIDEWSMRILLEELGALYGAGDHVGGVKLPQLRSRYRDWCTRRRSERSRMDQQVDWWHNRLRDVAVPESFPADRSRPKAEATHGGGLVGVHQFRLETGVIEEFQRITTRHRVTLFNGFLAVYAAFWGRIKGLEQVLIGTPICLRDDPAVERVVGFFLNMLPIPVELGHDPTFDELLDQVHGVLLEAYAHRDGPFDRIVQRLSPRRVPGQSPLFQTSLVYLDEPLPVPHLPATRAVPLSVKAGAAKWEILLSLTKQESGFVAEFEYDTERISSAMAARFAERFRTLLENIATSPDRPLSSLPGIGPAELAELARFEAGGSNLVREASIPAVFRSMAAMYPARVALSSNGEALTYQELDRWSDAIAARLLEQGMKPGGIVALELPRSALMIASMLGVLKAGGAYLPLDPNDPTDRRESLLGIAQPTIWINESSGTGRDPGICLDQRIHDVKIGREDRAYVMFTSGSTGTPKAVEVPHRGVLRLVRGTDFMRLDDSLVFLHHSPESFDASTLEIWAPLLNGGRLVLLPAGPLDLFELERCLKSEGCNAAWMTASLFHLVVDEFPSVFDSLDQILTGGDVVSPEHVRRLLSMNPRIKVINGYGPTENTTFTTCQAMTVADLNTPLLEHPLPIGRPIRGTSVRVLDRNGGRAPIGIPGELYAGGEGVALGYLGRPDFTAARFVVDPREEADDHSSRFYRTGDLVRWRSDGGLDFLGRMDRQIKINGFRIEPGEIEVAIRKLPGILDACVASRSRNGRGLEVFAWVVADSTAKMEPGQIKGELSERLPTHLVPSMIIPVDLIPKTPQGKVDYGTLPDPPATREGSNSKVAEEWTETERFLASLWRSMLNVERLQLDDDFFQIGGDSLRVLQLAVELERRFQRPFTSAEIIENSTLRRLASRCRPGESEPGTYRPVVYRCQRKNRPLFFIPGIADELAMFLPLLPFLPEDRAVLGLPLMLPHGSGDELPTIEAMAARMIAAIDQVEASGPPCLIGYSLGGNIAYEIARQLRQQGRDAPLLIILDSIPGRLVPTWRTLLRAVRALVRWLFTGDARQWRNASWQFRSLGKILADTCLPVSLYRRLMRRSVSSSQDVRKQRGHFRAWERAFHRYRPGSYDGRCFLVRAEGRTLGWSKLPPDLTWSRYAREVDVHLVSGEHRELFKPPHVQEIAAVVSTIFARNP